METKEKAVRSLKIECRNLDQRYKSLHTDYEERKKEYARNPTFTNYRKLHAIHSKLIKCSDELYHSQDRLIDAYWITLGIKHWQFRADKGESKQQSRA